MRAQTQEVADGSGTGRLRALLPALLLGLLLIGAFAGPLGGRRFYLRDVSQNHYPLRALITERLRAGSLPLWDPYHGGGTPLLANPNTLTLHPITLLFFVLPLPTAFTASIILQFALLAAGGYLLARVCGMGREASALVAAVLSLSGPAASLASMQNVLSAAAWVPIALWAFLRGLAPGRRWILAPAALGAAVVMIAAEPSCLLAMVLIGLVLAVTQPASSSGPVHRKACLAFAAVGIAGMVVAAAQIIPAAALLPLTERSTGFDVAEGLKWSLLPARLPEMVLPRLFGDPTRLSPISWWGGFLFEGRYPFLLSLYLGAIPCLLAGIGVWHTGPERTRRRALGVVAVLGLLLALGRGSLLYRALFEHLAPVRQVRYPERFVMVTLLALGLLAGYGLQRLIVSPLSRRTLGWLVGGAAAGFIVCALAAMGPVSDWWLSRCVGVPGLFLGTDAGAMVRGAFLRSALWAFGETAVLGALALYAWRRPAPSRLRAAALLVVVASALSMQIAASPARSTAAPGWLESASPLKTAVGLGPDAARLHHAPRPADLSVWARTDELIWGYRYDRFAYALMTGHPDGVPTALDAATDRMDLKDGPAIGKALESLPLARRVRGLAATRVGQVLSYETLEDAGLGPGASLDGLSRPRARLYSLHGVVPRLRFVTRARPLPPEGAAMALSDPDHDPLTTVLLERPPQPGPLDPTGQDGAADPQGGEATVVTEAPERVALRVRAARAGFVVLADAYAPGWRATLDGAPTALLRADGLFRAVAVPAGEHAVEMVYRPASVVTGLIVGGLGLLLLTGFAGMALWRGL